MTQTPELRGISTKTSAPPPALILNEAPWWLLAEAVGALFAFPAAEASPDRDTSRIWDLKNQTFAASDQQAGFQRDVTSRFGGAHLNTWWKSRSWVLCPTSEPSGGERINTMNKSPTFWDKKLLLSARKGLFNRTTWSFHGCWWGRCRIVLTAAPDDALH